LPRLCGRQMVPCKAKIAVALVVACVVVACNLPLVNPAITGAPVGEYDCYGLEAGRYAYTGLLKISVDGTVEFLGGTGSWTYDSERKEFEFAGAISVARARCEADRDRLSVDLQPGVLVAHAETGKMTCDVRD
jgi:hypothetical protein